MTREVVVTYIIVIGIQVIWGIFSDIKRKQYKWFIGRMGISIIYSAVINLIMYHTMY